MSLDTISRCMGRAAIEAQAADTKATIAELNGILQRQNVPASLREEIQDFIDELNKELQCL